MTTRAKGSKRSSEPFSTVSTAPQQRSAFERSYSHKSTIDAGFLYPLFVDEVLPGDTMNLRAAFLARMATPIKPFIDGLHMDIQFFFIPLRLVWTNFVRMMGERPDPADHNDYTVPQMVAPASVGHLVGSLSDYLGLPTDVPDYTHSALFHRAYALCFREWYRDQNLTDPPIVDIDDGPDDSTDYPLFRRGKRKDYFTGALLTAQKGTAVDLPLGTVAPLVGILPIDPIGGAPTFDGVGSDLKLKGEGTFNTVWSGTASSSDATWGDPQLEVDLDNVLAWADLSSATAATINDMRVAITTQHLLERDARGGTRYVEQMHAHFGISPPDLRLFRPELLGTGTMPIQPTQVEMVSVSTAFQFTGDANAYVRASGNVRGFMKTFDEHGIVMGIVSIRADLSYQQGLHRMFSRKTRLEFFWPDLQGLGEQAVESREIYTDGTGSESAKTGDFSIWGYQPRYEEYRHRNSIITGQFRSTFAQSLDLWHLGLDFGSRPVLNNAFIEENPPIERITVLLDDPQFLIDCYYKIRHVRPMGRFGDPGLTRF